MDYPIPSFFMSGLAPHVVWITVSIAYFISIIEQSLEWGEVSHDRMLGGRDRGKDPGR